MRDSRRGASRASAASLALLALMLAPLACAARFDVQGARAYARVVKQMEAGPRIPGTPGHDTIREWIAAEASRLGGRVERQEVSDTSLGHPLALTNLIAHFGPSGVCRIALLAHWDTRPFSDQDPDPVHRADPVPGANDAASGVAVLLEVAELMHGTPPLVGVDLVDRKSVV